MKRSVMFLLASATIATAPPLAAAAARTRVGVDHTRNVSFTVTNRAIAITLRPVDGQPNPLATELSGTDIVVACQGKSPSTGRQRIADATAVWPADATTFEGKLSRDISDGLKWCVLERPDGTDLAVTLKMRVPKPS